MDEPVTVRDVMNRSFVGVSEGDSVAGAAELMRDEGVHSAVVLRGREPVGMLDDDRLLELVADRLDPAETTAAELMRPVLTVAADERLEQAVNAMVTDGIRHLLVEDGDELAGSVSEHDVLAARAVMVPQPEPTEIGIESAYLGGEADLDTEVYSTQGVCENCGSLTRELSTHNGQLICPDCLAM